MNTITLHYLINLVFSEGQSMRLIDVVTIYLYESLDNHTYMKITEGFKIPEVHSLNTVIYTQLSCNDPCMD